jgi:hypothetical protein
MDLAKSLAKSLKTHDDFSQVSFEALRTPRLPKKSQPALLSLLGFHVCLNTDD